jgi:hypothetical protein
MFIWMRIKDHEGARTDAFDLGHVMNAKVTPFVQSARVCEYVAAPGSIDVQLDALTANGTLGVKGVRSSPAEQLYKFHKPYRQVSHVQSLTN